MAVGCVSTPQGQKMAPATQQVADKAAAVAETVLPIVAPYAAAVPYGGLVLALATGILGTYLRARPHLVANKEIMAGMKASKPSGVNPEFEMANATSNATKAIMAKAGV